MTEPTASRKKSHKGKVLAIGVVTLAGIIAYWLECGGGFGFGIGGFGGRRDRATETESRNHAPLDPMPCDLRLDAEGLHRSGKPITIAQAIDACRASGRAQLLVTGDAKYGELERTRQAFDQANIKLFTHPN
jgi:hypothetical protein